MVVAMLAQISEPFDSGTLYLAFCFDNGVTSGDGKQPIQRGSSVQVSYDGPKGAREFQIRGSQTTQATPQQ